MKLKTLLPILVTAALAAPARAQDFPPRPPGDVGYPQSPTYPPAQQYPPSYPPPPPPGGGYQSAPLPPPPGVAGQDTIVSPRPPRANNNPPTLGPDGTPVQPQAPKTAKSKTKQPPQGQPQATPPDSATGGTEPAEVPVQQAPLSKISNPTAVFSGLDKITGRVINFEAAIDETVQFGALQVTPRACYTRPATEIQNTTAFVEVDEITLAGDIKRIFTGWMFASSPGLHGVEHPIYDVWVTDCKTTPPAITASGGKK